MAACLPVNIIVAVCRSMGIGVNGRLPWTLKKEFDYFVNTCTRTRDPRKKNAVIHGRLSYEGLPPHLKPMPSLTNVVLTSNRELELPQDVLKAQCYEEAISLVNEHCADSVESIFVLGGQRVLEDALKCTRFPCRRIYITRIDADYECDTFMPQFDLTVYKKISLPEVPEDVQYEMGVSYRFEVYERTADEVAQ